MMENEITNAGIEMETKLSISSDGRTYLTTTAKWATFLAILAFIGTGIMVLVGIFMMIISPLSKLGSTFGFPASLFGLLYMILAVLYFFPAFYLYKFADKTKSALYNN
jgi:Zn-dependent protease with chaperone function